MRLSGVNYCILVSSLVAGMGPRWMSSTMGLYLSLYIITCSIDCIDLHSTDAPSYSNAVLPTDTVETPASDRQP